MHRSLRIASVKFRSLPAIPFRAPVAMRSLQLAAGLADVVPDSGPAKRDYRGLRDVRGHMACSYRRRPHWANHLRYALQPTIFANLDL